MKRFGIGVCFLLFASMSFGLAFIDTRSPNGDIRFLLTLGEVDGVPDVLYYDLYYKKDPVILSSPLRFRFEGMADWGTNLKMEHGSRTMVNEMIPLVYGERNSIPNHYNELIQPLREQKEPHRLCNFILRVFDEGVAFRFEFPQQEAMRRFTIAGEDTYFWFAADLPVWEEYGTEGEYKKVMSSAIQPNCETPLTVEIGEGWPFACILEADVNDYARMWLSPAPDRPHAVVSHLGGQVTGETPFTTPWRVILLADQPSQLMERSYVTLALNPPCTIPDTSWIKPGTVIRCTRLNTEGGKAYIDFATQHHIDYVHFDAGWYGPEREETSDPRVPKADLDLPYLLQYAKECGVGITVYVNRIALDHYLDEILPLYEQWGIKGIKFGFVAVGPQEKMKWLHDAITKAADHHLMIDIHDSYRPTGLSRTYPNLMTQEGIRGNEHMPTAEHNVTLPFCRYPAGAGDYTICYYNDRIQTTHTHQLAASIVMYSPLQFIFWYDTPDLYHGEPEIELFEQLPTVWDETRVIRGEIGHFITLARRCGDEWYLASMVDDTSRKMTIPLEVLNPGRNYIACLYSDDLQGDSRTHVKVERFLVDHETVITRDVPASGGIVVHCVPATEEDEKRYANPE